MQKYMLCRSQDEPFDPSLNIKKDGVCRAVEKDVIHLFKKEDKCGAVKRGMTERPYQFR